ncbi:MAG: nuclear transport factor 2 family protein [Sphingomonas sp.]|nr:nuclear transport factor 2 family protein [Sphingomonas sp.]
MTTPVAAAAAAAPEDGVKEAVLRLWKAWESGDERAASAIYDESLLDTDFHGVRRRWPEVRGFLKPNPPAAAVAIELRDFRIRLHGRAAVASYLVEDCRTRNGARNCLRFAATDFLIRRQSGWRIVGAHQSIIAATPTTQTGN